MEFNSIPFFRFLHHFFSKFSSHPLFSTIVALYTLILLYAPSFFLKITLSPVLNSTGIILLFLLRLGAEERPKTKFGSQEYGIIGYGVDERLLESRVLDCKDKWLPVSGGNLAMYPGSALESSSMESRFLDSIGQSQTHVEFEPKIGLGHESNQTHIQLDPKNSLGRVSYQTHVEFEPKIDFDDVSYQSRLEFKPGSSLKMECNQSNIEFEHDLGMESNSQDDHHRLETIFKESSHMTKEEKPTMVKMDPNQVDATMMFLEWNMRTPLEIIYEAYEGEEEDDDEKSNENDDAPDDKEAIGCEKYPSLSMYYPESETDSSLDDDFSMNENWETHESVLFKWEEEEREELIEISLDRYGKRSIEFCHADEDNLIEIDIFSKIN